MHLIHRYGQQKSAPARGGSWGALEAPPAEWPGVGWSDHWSFWQENYQAIMITDTAVFRYPYYHTPRDTFDKVDFDKAARVVDGVHRLVETLANEP